MAKQWIIFGLFVLGFGIAIYRVFIQNPPKKHNQQTRFRANHSSGVGAFGDHGSAYAALEDAEDKELETMREQLYEPEKIERIYDPGTQKFKD